LRFAYQHRAASRDLFARYLWARVGSTFVESKDRPLDEVLKLTLAEDANAAMRGSLTHDVYAAVLLIEDSRVHQALARTFLLILLQHSAAPLHHRLAEVELYNLIFDKGRAAFPAATVLPQPADRAAVRAALSTLDSDGAKEIAKWLEAAK